jgi:hypothetical protein
MTNINAVIASICRVVPAQMSRLYSIIIIIMITTLFYNNVHVLAWSHVRISEWYNNTLVIVLIITPFAAKIYIPAIGSRVTLLTAMK